MIPFISDCVRSLEQTPKLLETALENRPDEWLDSRHGEDILSPREVAGHLIHCELEDWLYRAQLIMDGQESFPPFDTYAMIEYSCQTPLPEMLERFRDLRQENLEKLKNMEIQEEDLSKTAQHPSLGTVTLKQLLNSWVAHDLYHLGQIYKSYSSLLVDEVGPWQKMLNLPHFN